MARKTVPPDGKAVLITGTSSGLGRAAALHLERLGFHVFAGVRTAADGDRLAAASTAGRIRPVTIDVTSADLIADAAAAVRAQLAGLGSPDMGGPALWGLVNNAGICVSGPLECVSPEQLRHQFETNVVGQLSVIQAFLPLLRASRGRIVNVTSGLGRIALPYLGAYASAQFAKEGLSDTLRRELTPFGVSVSVVQPGMIMTPIWDKLARAGQDTIDTAGDAAGLYRGSFLRFLQLNEQQAQVSRTRPEDFASVVATALTTARPKTRYCVGSDMRMASVIARLLPDSLIDKRLAPLVQPA